MAAPPEKTIKNLTGTWVLNKGLSGDVREILTIQNVGMLLRNAIYSMKITLHIKVGSDAEGQTTIDIKQVADGSLPFVSSETQEHRTLDNLWRDHEDQIFKKVKGRSHFITIKDYTNDSGAKSLTEGFLDETYEPEGSMESYAESYNDGWTATQIWGFELIDNARRYVRHIAVKNGSKLKEIKLVYDFVSDDPQW